MTNKGTIWDNKYGCSEKYRCATVLYLLSMFSRAYNIVVYRCVESPGHVKDFVYVLNATDKSFLSMLIKTVQLPGVATNYSQMIMHASMSNTDISL